MGKQKVVEDSDEEDDVGATPPQQPQRVRQEEFRVGAAVNLDEPLESYKQDQSTEQSADSTGQSASLIVLATKLTSLRAARPRDARCA